MELAFLVYWVNNLAYNGSFLFVAALVPLIMWCVCYAGYTFHKIKVYTTVLKVGDKYTLSSDIGVKGFKKGEQVIVTDIYRYSRTIGIKSVEDSKKYDFDIRPEEFRKSVEPTKVEFNTFVKPRKSWFVVGMFLLTLHTLLPNKQTTIYCVSAYLVQTVLTDSRTQELGTAAYEATLTQLKEWGKQSDDVAKLIKPLVEKAINEKVNPTTTANK